MIFLALTAFLLLEACETQQADSSPTTDRVFEALQSAYTFREKGNISAADSVYQALLLSSIDATDSSRISRSYVSVLIEKGKLDEALYHIDIGFPSSSEDPEDLLRRFSYRFSVYFYKKNCDSIRIELNNLFALVSKSGPLQLTMEDLIYNRTIVDSLCSSPTITDL
jgi:D-serine deaminase-like pyridoxal phosphate-dependent protein